MVEIVGSAIAPNRAAVRAFVEGKRTVLEAAQASGRLARVKIDLKDEAAALQDGSADDIAAVRTMLDEEIEALCADLRLASVTVQAQIERRVRNWERGAVAAMLTFLGSIIFLVAIQEPNGLIGFGLPLVAAVIAFFAFS